jgi:hypothetical protein
MFERFTREARQVVTGAQQECRRLGHPHIDTVHLLLVVRQQHTQIPRRGVDGSRFTVPGDRWPAATIVSIRSSHVSAATENFDIAVRSPWRPAACRFCNFRRRFCVAAVADLPLAATCRTTPSRSRYWVRASTSS